MNRLQALAEQAVFEVFGPSVMSGSDGSETAGSVVQKVRRAAEGGEAQHMLANPVPELRKGARQITGEALGHPKVLVFRVSQEHIIAAIAGEQHGGLRLNGA